MIGIICLVFSFVIFILAAFDLASHEGWNLIALGLAFLVAAFLFGGVGPSLTGVLNSRTKE